jgi:pimeloyl-ACP methyl ester carboxylesterase
MSFSPPKLDPKEEHFCIASYIEGLTLFLRYMPPNARQTNTPKIVLYVHGGSFPSALSIAHRFDGRSWRDELADAGFHVWGLDFHGFGASDPYPEMAEPAECNPVLGRAEVGRFAGRCPDLVDRLVFFGPVTWRQKKAEPQTFAAWPASSPSRVSQSPPCAAGRGFQRIEEPASIGIGSEAVPFAADNRDRRTDEARIVGEVAGAGGSDILPRPAGRLESPHCRLLKTAGLPLFQKHVGLARQKLD